MVAKRFFCISAGIFLSALAYRGARSATAPAESLNVPDCVRVTYDKFLDRTTVQLKNQYAYKDAGFMAATFAGQISIFFTCVGNTVAAPDSLVFEVVHGALLVHHERKENEVLWSFRPEDEHTLYVIVDGHRLEAGQMRYLRGSEASAFLDSRRLQAPSSAIMSVVPEVLTLSLPTREVLAMLDAHSTEGRVDDFTFFLQNTRGHTLDHYRDFASFVRSAAPDSASSASSR